ncbi:MAG: hydrogenase maturation protease [Thermoflexales bacterium]|nr:hydrogenase maturation protease [Thermoflexales bacterium]MCS7324017.1 hydrogenase maturation protease [Thermoflexales bacterium]MCX7939392.1 hydrogenase maturation protease [Thermoflexales bacterium]MDW8053501.1 hydrogenase maturation protease [Anaerolineae bacterium]MDW8292203.1 hydrogenase maturation protease [Anaerolineae bacterium]
MRTAPVMVIGYGSTLHSDDAAGVRLAEAIAARDYPGVHVFTVTQLVPELAEPLARSRMAIFADASVSPPRSHRPWRLFGVTRLQPAHAWGALVHQGDPRALLALAQSLYGYHPPAWLITIPGEHFELGDELSPLAQQSLAQALKFVERLLSRMSRSPRPSSVSSSSHFLHR